MLIDSHCHLNNESFKEDLDAVIQRAHLMGVQRMLSICTTLEEAEEIQEIARRYSQVNHSVGVHPHDAEQAIKSNSLQSDLEQLIQNSPKVVALGETGLDYYYNNSPREAQKESFRIHIQQAKAYNLPLIVHTRDADEDTIQLLSEEKGNIRGVIHCFSGSQFLAEQALELGFYISISGIITFKKADEIRRIVQDIVPLERLLVETDSPFLAPLPHRGKRNEPAFVPHVAETLAELKSVSVNMLSTITTENYLHLFGWK